LESITIDKQVLTFFSEIFKDVWTDSQRINNEIIVEKRKKLENIIQEERMLTNNICKYFEFENIMEQTNKRLGEIKKERISIIDDIDREQINFTAEFQKFKKVALNLVEHF
jgi:hypothetical protein